MQSWIEVRKIGNLVFLNPLDFYPVSVVNLLEEDGWMFTRTDFCCLKLAAETQRVRTKSGVIRMHMAIARRIATSH